MGKTKNTPVVPLALIKEFEAKLKSGGFITADEHISALRIGNIFNKTIADKKAARNAVGIAGIAPQNAAAPVAPCLKFKKVPVVVFDPITGKNITVLKDVCVQPG